jgi:hypothetical protein
MLQSRREFLSGAGAVLAFPRAVAVEILAAEAALLVDAALLAELWPDELELVREVLAAYPALSVAKCIEMLRAAGM